MEEQLTEEKVTRVVYPTLGNRYKAMVIDGLIQLVLIFLAGAIMADWDGLPNWTRAVPWVLILLIYEPVFLMVRGATIGHAQCGIEVKRNSNTASKLSIFAAMVRVIVKISLGWLSFLSMLTDSKRRALHDFASGSIVRYSSQS